MGSHPTRLDGPRESLKSHYDALASSRASLTCLGARIKLESGPAGEEPRRNGSALELARFILDAVAYRCTSRVRYVDGSSSKITVLVFHKYTFMAYFKPNII